jgi:hypothetical protein
VAATRHSDNDQRRLRAQVGFAPARGREDDLAERQLRALLALLRRAEAMNAPLKAAA